MAEKTAETNAGREERPETGSEEETSKDYSTGSEGTMGDVQATEEERIAQAIDGKGEFLSDELKKLLIEIEIVQGLRAGTLGEEIEARLRGVTEPSVEKLREALKEEIEKLEERFNVRRRKDGTSESPGNPTRTETGEDPGGTPKPVEACGCLYINIRIIFYTASLEKLKTTEFPSPNNIIALQQNSLLPAIL